MYNISLREGTWDTLFGVPLLGLWGVLVLKVLMGVVVVRVF